MDNFLDIVSRLVSGNKADLVSMDQGAQKLIDAGTQDHSQEFEVLIQQRDWVKGLGIIGLIVSLGNHGNVGGCICGRKLLH